ncbi:DUF6089 family protein [Bacteroidales bacterium OttesenSCG-928-C19]|nr:DUF6089 family protein [Bacteroidales bacterium OttesenSCG-928-C19]
MKRNCIKIVFPVVFLLFSYQSFSQVVSRSELGIIAGGMYYIGDLNHQQYWNTPSLGGGIIYRYTFNDRWVFKANALYGQVSQLEDKIKERNLGFKSSIFEASGHIEFNFLPFLTNRTPFTFTPYIFCGLGFFVFNPKAELDGEWYNLRDYRTEGQESLEYPDRKTYSQLQVNFPFGIGFKWDVSKTICLGFEWGLRKTWTDYLDDVSTTYVDENILLNDGGEIAKELADRSSNPYHYAGSRRGDSSKDDWYAFVGTSLTFKIRSLSLRRKCNN